MTLLTASACPFP